jgi:tripartite-type tricarboxylate transporter receptor subunit TctC
MIKNKYFQLLCAGIAALCAGAALAQDYPNRAIRFVVPFPAGGQTDTLARVLAAPLSKTLN